MSRAQIESETRARLIRATIELCAAEGFYAPSLRRIGKAAGQKNTAVVHYHFTDREGLLRACVEFLLDHLDEPIEVEPWLPRPAAQMSPLAMAVYPFCLPLLLLPERHPEWGEAGVKFLGRVLQGESEALSVYLERVSEREAEAFVETLSPMLPHLSAQLLRARYDLVSVTLMGALTSAPYDDALPAAPGRGRNLAALHMLMDFVIGGLSAPTT